MVFVNMELFSDGFGAPGDVLRKAIESKGWTQDDLAFILGKSRKAVNDLICGRSSITPEMAVALGAAFGNTAKDWMGLESSYRISRVREDRSELHRKARLMQLAPIRDMQRRGWIKETNVVDELEAELKNFFGTDNLEDPIQFPIAMRRISEARFLNAPERAWCYRARRLAALLPITGFNKSRLDELAKKLRVLAAHPKEARHLSRVFAEFGIRFAVVEPLPGTKIDGAAFWLDDHSPVIAISGRIDRVDNIWFTVMHEFAHIYNDDALSVDSDLLGDDMGVLVEEEAERLANERAADLLIPRDEIDSFIRRVGPLYSKERIIQFANRVRVHPGIIIGQLQHRKEIGYSANREMLTKLRNVVIDTAITDGWGKMISPSVMR